MRSSLIVSISGGFKLYIALLLLGIEPNISFCLAFSLLIYSVYTLDRALKCEEDLENGNLAEINRIPIFLIIISFLVSSAFIIRKIIPPYFVLFPFIIGFLYTKGIMIGNCQLRLKKGLGVKNSITSLTWGGTMAIFLFPFASLFQIIFVATFFFFKSFINTVIYDFRDIKGDSAVGMVTLPIYFGESKTQSLLYAMHILVYLGLFFVILNGIILFEPEIIIYSLAIGFFYIHFYSNSKVLLLRDTIVDGEWIMAFAIRSISIQLI